MKLANRDDCTCSRDYSSLAGDIVVIEKIKGKLVVTQSRNKENLPGNTCNSLPAVFLLWILLLRPRFDFRPNKHCLLTISLI